MQRILGDNAPMSRPSPRLQAAVDMLDLQPHQHLLEIGCGHGVAVSLICPHLDTGSITALDRSPTMIATAQRRNADHVAAGRATFHTTALSDADLPAAHFDTIFAIHVGLFLRTPARELASIRRWLAPHGRLHLIYQPFTPDQVAATGDTLTTVLGDNGFTVTDVRTRPLTPAPVLCVVAA
jgi:cyclopropane fatty-acyl-phospholipid synthase-like methyltransferase